MHHAREGAREFGSSGAGVGVFFVLSDQVAGGLPVTRVVVTVDGSRVVGALAGRQSGVGRRGGGVRALAGARKGGRDRKACLACLGPTRSWLLLRRDDCGGGAVGTYQAERGQVGMRTRLCFGE